MDRYFINIFFEKFSGRSKIGFIVILYLLVVDLWIAVNPGTKALILWKDALQISCLFDGIILSAQEPLICRGTL